jgi:hypothetical protein
MAMGRAGYGSPAKRVKGSTACGSYEMPRAPIQTTSRGYGRVQSAVAFLRSERWRGAIGK